MTSNRDCHRGKRGNNKSAQIHCCCVAKKSKLTQFLCKCLSLNGTRVLASLHISFSIFDEVMRVILLFVIPKKVCMQVCFEYLIEEFDHFHPLSPLALKFDSTRNWLKGSRNFNAQFNKYFYSGCSFTWIIFTLFMLQTPSNGPLSN